MALRLLLALPNIWPNNQATTANVPPLKSNRFSSHSRGLSISRLHLKAPGTSIPISAITDIFTGQMTPRPNQLCHCQCTEGMHNICHWSTFK